MSENPANAMHRHRNKGITLGFGAVILLMLLPAVIALLHIERLRGSVREISEGHSVHAQLAHRMYDASRERAFLLFRVVHEEDPFVADKQVMRFRELAGTFAEARQALMKLQLAPGERALLEKQGRAAEVTLLQQDLVLGLIVAGNLGKAQDTFVNFALPSQEIVLAMIDRLIKLQNQEVLNASRRAAEDGRLAHGLLAIGTVVAILISLGVVYVTRRWTNAQMERAARHFAYPDLGTGGALGQVGGELEAVVNPPRPAP
jgi:CHASE3 domain sensor protein